MAAPAPPQEAREHAREDLERRDPLWPEQVAVLTAILLRLTLPDKIRRTGAGSVSG